MGTVFGVILEYQAWYLILLDNPKIPFQLFDLFSIGDPLFVREDSEDPQKDC